MTDQQRIDVLRAALERIRVLTMCREDRMGRPIPKSAPEKSTDWALIQAEAARALRESEEG